MCRMPRFSTALARLACAAVCAVGLGASTASATPATYTHTQSIPVPPASNYAGVGGGDGWAVALSPTSVYNVFHHQAQVTVACHRQADASACWAPKTVKDGTGGDFGSTGQPGLYLDQATGKLYLFANRNADNTAGVLCFDTVVAEGAGDPFCGFTELTPVGGGPGAVASPSISNPNVVGGRMYAMNYVSGKDDTGAANRMLCMELSTHTPCAGQPYSVGIGAGVVSVGNFPSPAASAIGSRIFFPLTVDGAATMRCFDTATGAQCAGSWPQPIANGLPSSVGSPFPLLSTTGVPTGVCLPAGATAPCFALDGTPTALPVDLAAVLPTSDGWNGPPVVIGPRVYLPSGNGDVVFCWDFLAGKACDHFPKQTTNANYLYTVNPDPARPDCIWVNADGGSAQIQNFDAYSGAACGTGAIRVLSSSFIAPQAQCAPTDYLALRLVDPARSAYADGTVTIADASGTPLPGAAALPIDGDGAVSLTSLGVDPKIGLPQFIIALNGAPAQQSAVSVELSWRADYDAACATPGTVAQQDAVPTPTPAPAAAPTPTPAPTRAPDQGAVLAERAAPRLVGTATFATSTLRFGRSTTLKVRVTNKGNAASTAGKVCVTLSKALVILSAPKGVTVSGATVCAKRGAISPGKTVTVASGIVVRGVVATPKAAVRDATNDGVSVTGDQLRVLRVQTRGGGVTG